MDILLDSIRPRILNAIDFTLLLVGIPVLIYCSCAKKKNSQLSSKAQNRPRKSVPQNVTASALPSISTSNPKDADKEQSKQKRKQALKEGQKLSERTKKKSDSKRAVETQKANAKKANDKDQRSNDQREGEDRKDAENKNGIRQKFSPPVKSVALQGAANEANSIMVTMQNEFAIMYLDDSDVFGRDDTLQEIAPDMPEIDLPSLKETDNADD